jgi:hypothetical protein
MDLGFFRRTRNPGAGRSTARLDFGMLTATLKAYQAASVTARVQARTPCGGQVPQRLQTALVEILTAGPQWRDAVSEQGGSFSPDHVQFGFGT